MGVSVLIQSTTVNEFTAVAGVSITKALRAIPTASIRTVDRAGAYLPAVGNHVEIQDDGTIMFGGSILEVERIKRRSSLALLETHVSCVGLADRLEKRLTGQYEWTGETGGTIIAQMVYQSLAGDITDTTLVEAGPVVDSFITDLATAREFLEAVCGLTGFEYYVMPDGKLAYFDASLNLAPFGITDGLNVTKLTTRETREDFCNNATAKVASVLRDPETQSFVGNGVNRSFPVTYPVSSTPTVFVAGVEQTVGISGVDTGKDFYWSDGSAEVHQDSGAAPVGVGIAIDITYVGIESIMVNSVNVASVSARATAENNSGNYEKLLQIEQRLTRADAQAIVDAYVDRHSALSIVLTIETNNLIEPDLKDIEPGQVLPVTLTGWNAVGNYLVRSVNLQMRKDDSAEYRWEGRIEAISGPVLRNYIDVFRDITGGGGRVSGSGSIPGGSGGSGTYVFEPAKLTAPLTISAPIAATAGARLVVFVTQGAGSYTISWGPEFVVLVGQASAIEDEITAFDFVGRSDGLWWQTGHPLLGLL